MAWHLSVDSAIPLVMLSRTRRHRPRDIGSALQIVSSLSNEERFHQTTAWVLRGVIALHGIGALYHTLIEQDRLLRPMLPG